MCCGCQSLTLGWLLNGFFISVFETQSLTEPGACYLTKSGGREPLARGQPTCLSLPFHLLSKPIPPVLGLQVYTITLSIRWVLRPQIRSSCWCNKHFAHSLSSQPLYDLLCCSSSRFGKKNSSKLYLYIPVRFRYIIPTYIALPLYTTLDHKKSCNN